MVRMGSLGRESAAASADRIALIDRAGLGTDLARGEMQHGDAMRGHPRVAGQGALVVLRGEMVGAGVDLAGDTRLRPPRIRAGDELIARVQPGIENGFRRSWPA